MVKKLIIAIDGHSSCGKSTLAKALAKVLKYRYIDTGAMYRCVTLYIQRNFPALLNEKNVDDSVIYNILKKIEIVFRFNSTTQKNEAFLNGENVEDEIRNIQVSNSVSQVAAIKEVRTHLVKLQQDMGKEQAIVMDGRDIGSVVFPNADLKIFMTARPEIRAKRRFDELTAKGETLSFQEVLDNVNMRDHIDQTREVTPLIQTQDAKVLDNSDITQEEQFHIALKWAKEILERT